MQVVSEDDLMLPRTPEITDTPLKFGGTPAVEDPCRSSRALRLFLLLQPKEVDEVDEEAERKKHQRGLKEYLPARCRRQIVNSVFTQINAEQARLAERRIRTGTTHVLRALSRNVLADI